MKLPLVWIILIIHSLKQFEANQWRFKADVYCVHLERLWLWARLLNQETHSAMIIPACSELKTRPLRPASVSTEQWLLALCFIIRDQLTSELVENLCLFLARCVGLGKGHEECSCVFLGRLFSVRFSAIHTINMFVAQPPEWLFVYSSFVDCTKSPPESHWPHVNYFVNPHISFNCCGFVYPGDQIELGEIVGGCQHRSARKTDECISNTLTMGATMKHVDSITDLQ